jgi:LacI family transcriptional regulator
LSVVAKGGIMVGPGRHGSELVRRRARTPRPRKRRRVLFVTDFYLESLLAGIVEYARGAGWILDANMRLHGRFPPAKEAAGILATVQSARVRDWLRAQPKIPIVRMTVAPFELPYPAVESDYGAAGRAGARHLLELGHVHFAFYSQFVMRDAREAQDGFVAELASVGRQARVLNLSAAFPRRDSFDIVREERHRWLARKLKRLPKPLAVMCDDDRRALELVVACDLAGLRVPEDVAVLGCDNHWVEQRLSPISLSTVDMNLKGVGWKAASLLDELMQGAPPPGGIITVPPVGVVARRSTATFITDSTAVTAAVVHLREHFREPLRLAELAREAGLSERVLELEFKRRVGRPPREELRRARLACAARLLRDTELKLAAVAGESGFGSAAKLCEAFAKAYHLSPRVWRQQAKGGW